MKICTTCKKEKIVVHGRKCKECRKEYQKKQSAKKREKTCPICEIRHNKMAKECSMKCKLLNRFKVDKGCWIWSKSLNESGYGKLQENQKGKRKYLMSHRESYKVFKGNIPKGKLILHQCDRPACINPDHLFIGTMKDNTRDMLYKGRGGRQKLKKEDIHEIRKLIAERFRNIDIASFFRVNPTTISSIKKGLTWSHITED